MEATADIDKKETQHTMEQVDLPSDEQQQQSREPATDSTDLGSQSQSQPPLKVTKLNKVYIGGLPDDTREADLQDCFGAFGHIKSIELKTGYGFVEFDSRAAAEKAVAVYNDGVFLGNTIRVELSHGGGKTSQKQLTEPGACFKCGQHGHWARECPNHSTTVHKRPWVDRSAGNYHQRSDSYRENQPNAPYTRPRDDYRAARPKGDEYAPRPRDYGAREGDFRRPPSPTYDYSRGEQLPPVGGYNDRRSQGPRPGYGIDRPPSPYGTSRAVTAPYGSRDYERGYERPAPYYDPRAPPAAVAPTYPDRRSDYVPPQTYAPNHSYTYPPAREPSGRRSPPRQGGRYQNYGNQGGYNRPYERRRSASPPPPYQHRDDVPAPVGNGYSRNSTSYGRPQPYSAGYGDAPNSGRASMVPSVNTAPGDRMGARDYRGGYRP